MCCLKRGLWRSFTRLKSILFPLSCSTFARCLFLWCMGMRLSKSNAIQGHVCFSQLPSFSFLLPHKTVHQDSVNPGPAQEVVYCLLSFPVTKARFLLLPPWTEGEGGVDAVSKSWVITLLCGQSASESQVAFHFGLGGSWVAPFVKGHFLVVWCTASVTSELWMLTSCGYRSVALNPCQ